MNVSDIMTGKPLSVSPDHSVMHAVRIMLNNKVSGLPVVDDRGAVVGIITEGDLMRRTELGTDVTGYVSPAQQVSEEQALAYTKSHGWRVGDAMTRDVVAIDGSASIARVAELMSSRNIKRLPVMEGDRLAGIVSRTDLLRATLERIGDRPAAGDEAIMLAVITRLETELGLSRDAIRVYSEDSHVRLCGAVENEPLRQAARVAAESVKGVASVANELWVQE